MTTDNTNDLPRLSGIINDQQRRIQELETEKATMRKRLRDEFAMAALAQVMAQLYGETKDTLEADVFKRAAGVGAYQIADAMLEARK
jgi:hypothetical protein